MSEEDDDKESKTEEPSQRKLEEAVKKGNVVNSKEVNSFFMIFFLTLIVIWVFPVSLTFSAKSLKLLIENAGNIDLDQGMLGIILPGIINKILLAISPIFLIVIIVAIASSYIQHGEFIFSGEQLKPDITKLSLIKGFKRIFSKKSLVEFVKSFLKVFLVAIFLYFIILSDIKELTQYQNLPIVGIMAHMSSMVNHLLVCVCIIMAALASLDFFYQRFEYYNSLKMSKHELKEEYKQTEGSPEIKQKIRALRREQAQKAIKQTVPTATVVITNPEHFAIALKYEASTMPAPIVVAKGVDFMAQAIKEIANQERIPIVENPPLARGLYKAVKINQEIPMEYYEAVAKIIGYVMSLENSKKNKKF
jgi:flagellar biosynthetic protein FlhB